MPRARLPIENKQFGGIMNLDDNNDVIPAHHHKYAMNVRFRGHAGSNRVESIPGNTSITNSLPSGQNVCIGSHFDEVKNRVYYFNYNSNGRNGIYYYDTILGTITPVLVSFTNSYYDIFGFDPNYPIVSINIVYKDTNEGDVLYWTDRNQRPCFLNIQDALSNTLYSSGTNWQSEYLRVARIMPLISPICNYSDYTTTGIGTLNNLKGKLFQFRYRWVYRDNTKSTWSPYSKLFAPSDADSLATDIDPRKNNAIEAVIRTGNADCVKIEVSARQSLSTTFTTPLLVTTLDKSLLGIADNSVYTYYFANDGSYEYVDIAENDLLFDYVPKKANAQELLNGNVLIYGGITEGNTPNINLNIPAPTITLVANSATSPPLTFVNSDTISGSYPGPFTGSYFLNMAGNPQVGDTIALTISVFDSTATPPTYGVTINYTVGSHTGDTTLTILEQQLRIAINATVLNSTYHITAIDQVTPNVAVVMTNIPGTGRVVYANTAITYATPPGPTPTDVNTSIYKHNSRYAFGLAYFDEYGVTNGVMTNDTLKIITPEIENTNLTNTQLTIPSIQFSINNPPPAWAKYFSWVRTNNLTVNSFKSITTDGAYQNTANGYLDITNYNTNSNGYPAYTFTKGDRIRIIGVVGGSATVTPPYYGNSSIIDYSILDVINDKPTGSTFPTTGFFIKLEYDSNMSAWGTSGHTLFYIEVYTPETNTSTDVQVFYEFGETYSTGIDVNGNLIHLGQQQNQVIGAGAQPAIFNFYRGDIYSRERGGNLWILDQSVSDRYPSEVVGNGRPFVIDLYAKEIYNSTLVRYGGTYQQGTLINDINRFYPINYDEYDRSKGDIQRFKVREKLLRVFQNRATGVVNVYATELTNQDGSSNLIGSVNIINPINYYAGRFGIGNLYCSLASSSSADYFVDPINGYHIRLAGDGNTALSELYKGQYFFPEIAGKYLDTGYVRSTGGYAKVLGMYDSFEEEYVSVFQSGTKSSVTLNPYTVGFNEKKNAYSSFYSYEPEWFTSANNVIISWNNGVLYVHNNTTQNTFYGVNTPSVITFVFNSLDVIKKTFDYVGVNSNDYWVSNIIGDVNTSLGQKSNVVVGDYELIEGMYHASLSRDSNSLGGVNDGDYLKGTWIEMTFRQNSGTNFVYLSGLYIGYKISARNYINF